MSALQNLQRRHFVETSVALLDWWIEQFPSALVAKEQRVKLNGVVKGNEERERACLEEWHAGMCTPLHASVKYAAALRRILGEDGTLYHACAYKDLPAVLASATDFAMLHALEPGTCLEAKPECKPQLWALVHQLNQYAQQFFAHAVAVPTHDDIRANIRVHKASKAPAKPAMATGFDAAYDELMARLDAPSLEGDRIGSWAAAVREHGLREACERRDVAALRAVPFAHEGTAQAVAKAALDERAWALATELCSFAGVQSSIPANMMSRIENTAHRIAGEIACGKTDLGSLNLAQLGQSVLEGCDTSDVQQLASGMDSLLPMLQTLHKGAGGH